MDLIPTTTMLSHYAVISVYASLVLALLGLAGKWFGPLVRPKWPALADGCTAVYGFLGDALNHVLKSFVDGTPPAAGPK